MSNLFTLEMTELAFQLKTYAKISLLSKKMKYCILWLRLGVPKFKESEIQ